MEKVKEDCKNEKVAKLMKEKMTSDCFDFDFFCISPLNVIFNFFI